MGCLYGLGTTDCVTVVAAGDLGGGWGGAHDSGKGYWW